MPAKTRLVMAIASSALFDLKESDAVFRRQGLEAYRNYQIAHEKDVLEPGAGFALVKKLLQLNDVENVEIEVILLSRNSADTGLRVFNAIEEYELDIRRAALQEVRHLTVTCCLSVRICFCQPIQLTSLMRWTTVLPRPL